MKSSEVRNKWLISLTEQFCRLRSILIIIFCLGCLVLIGILALSQRTGILVSHLTRDPAAVTGSIFYIGILSNLGILLWTAAAVVCLFSAALNQQLKSRHYFHFFLWSGSFGALLTLDDLFLFHEKLLPYVFGIPEWIYPIGYAAITVSYLFSFRRVILRSNYLILLLALLFMGTSVAMDRLLPFSELEILAEDGFKFMGILFWATYFINTAYTAAISKQDSHTLNYS